ncbi:MAG: hypothetical protein IJ192_02575 [Clostridia bacterium]|nr:hypothetical protein [Clostridia bacterium]
MQLTINSLFPLTEEEKQTIVKNSMLSAPSENEITVDKEMWQKVLQRLNQQENQITEQGKRIQELFVRVDTLTKKLEAPENNSTASAKPTVSPKPNVIDSPKKKKPTQGEPLTDGEREDKKITDNWDAILASVEDGTYRTKYKIGNYKPLDLGSEGIVNMQIAAFDADPLADGSGRAAITWISKNLLKNKHRMNPKYEAYKIGTGCLVGWKNSEMRKYLNTEVKPMIPEMVRNSIKKVKKYSCSKEMNSKYIYNEETEDFLWIPSAREVFEDDNLEIGESKAVYYKSLFSCDKDRIKAIEDDGDFWWWLRSANRDYYEYYFNCVISSGSDACGNAAYYSGVALSFCT